MTPSDAAAAARRPLKSRETRWASTLAATVAQAGVSPNSISIASIFFAVFSAAAYVGSAHVTKPALFVGLYIIALLGIQGRLLCNLLDGMVAIEGGRKGKSGEVYNDLPDRIADPIILVAAGYAAGSAWGLTLGWAAAAMALMTAYVRVLGRSVGAGAYFIGPMAKQHRMALLTAATVIAAVVVPWGWQRRVLTFALALIIVGCVVTVWRRTARIVRDLEGA